MATIQQKVEFNKKVIVAIGSDKGKERYDFFVTGLKSGQAELAITMEDKTTGQLLDKKTRIVVVK